MIVKVQLAIVTTGDVRVLIYNEDRSLFYEGPAEDVTGADALSLEPKQFWHANIDNRLAPRILPRLISPADWQDW